MGGPPNVAGSALGTACWVARALAKRILSSTTCAAQSSGPRWLHGCVSIGSQPKRGPFCSLRMSRRASRTSQQLGRGSPSLSMPSTGPSRQPGTPGHWTQQLRTELFVRQRLRQRGDTPDHCAYWYIDAALRLQYTRPRRSTSVSTSSTPPSTRTTSTSCQLYLY